MLVLLLVDFLLLLFLVAFFFFVFELLALLLAFDADFDEDFVADFLLVLLALFGLARQCDLVFTPFLFTDDLRHVQSELLEQALDERPLHWLAAALLVDRLMAAARLNAIMICFIFKIRGIGLNSAYRPVSGQLITRSVAGNARRSS
ncbi:MAG: hypothetical protein HKN50_07630 [Gammaproteobacteria bacterium]|nr:hypothetical protein [Gammaproteobacteria bacterium]